MKFVSLIVTFFFQMVIAKQKFWGNCSNDEDCLKYKGEHKLRCTLKDGTTEGMCLPAALPITIHSCVEHISAIHWCPEGDHCCKITNKRWGTNEGICVPWSCEALSTKELFPSKRFKIKK